MPGRVTQENMEKVFTYQPATPAQQDQYKAVRNAAITLADTILRVVPDCADRSSALRGVREARMWANAAIALEGEV